MNTRLTDELALGLARLGFSEDYRQRFVGEIHEHTAEIVRELELSGLESERAEAEALIRMGTSDSLLRQVRQQHPLRSLVARSPLVSLLSCTMGAWILYYLSSILVICQFARNLAQELGAEPAEQLIAGGRIAATLLLSLLVIAGGRRFQLGLSKKMVALTEVATMSSFVGLSVEFPSSSEASGLVTIATGLPPLYWVTLLIPFVVYFLREVQVSTKFRASTALLILSAFLGGCAGRERQIDISGSFHEYPQKDGSVAEAVSLFAMKDGKRKDPEPNLLLVFLTGSEPRDLNSLAEQLAMPAESGAEVLIPLRRGADHSGEVISEDDYHRGATRQNRASDFLACLQGRLEELSPGTPCLVIGSSEGGVIAASVADQLSGVAGIVLLSSGGGMTQAEELRELWRDEPSRLFDLERAFAEIASRPESHELWAGHSFRRWSSFLSYTPVVPLARCAAPVLVLHGTQDKSVPMTSALKLVERVKSLGKSNLSLVAIEGVGHRLGFDKMDSPEKLHVFQLIVDWIAENKLVSPDILRRHHELLKAYQGG